MGERGRRMVEERYSWSVLIEKHVVFYDGRRSEREIRALFVDLNETDKRRTSKESTAEDAWVKHRCPGSSICRHCTGKMG